MSCALPSCSIFLSSLTTCPIFSKPESCDIFCDIALSLLSCFAIFSRPLFAAIGCITFPRRSNFCASFSRLSAAEALDALISIWSSSIVASAIISLPVKTKRAVTPEKRGYGSKALNKLFTCFYYTTFRRECQVKLFKFISHFQIELIIAERTLFFFDY